MTIPPRGSKTSIQACRLSSSTPPSAGRTARPLGKHCERVTCLAQLLASGADEYSSLSGVELVRRKVKCIYLRGGVFGEAVEPDFNFAQGIMFSKPFFQNWPQEVDMMFSPMEAGQDVEYTPEQVIADVSWTDTHPIGHRQLPLSTARL